MTFVKLTRNDFRGTPIYIVLGRISAVFNDAERSSGTVIRGDGLDEDVVEKPEEVLRLIDEAEKRMSDDLRNKFSRSMWGYL